MSIIDELRLREADLATLARDEPEGSRRGGVLRELGMEGADVARLASDLPERPPSARPARARRSKRLSADPTLVAAVVERVREAEGRQARAFEDLVIARLGLAGAGRLVETEIPAGEPLSEAQANAADWTDLPEGTRISGEMLVREGLSLSDPGEIVAD